MLPPGYSPHSLLEQPAKRKAILPIQGGGGGKVLLRGFRVRDPNEAKEDIKNQSFTQGEEDLFEYLHFNKQFIRDYIAKSETSKERFFEFWSMYVKFDGTDKLNFMATESYLKVKDYMLELLNAHQDYLLSVALPLLLNENEEPYIPPQSTQSQTQTQTQTQTPVKSTPVELDRKETKEAVEIILRDSAQINILFKEMYSKNTQISSILTSQLDPKKIEKIIGIHNEIITHANVIIGDANNILEACSKALIKNNLIEVIEKLQTSVKDQLGEMPHDEKFINKLIPFSLGVSIAAHNVSLEIDDIVKQAKEIVITVKEVYIPDEEDDEDDEDEEDEEDDEDHDEDDDEDIEPVAKRTRSRSPPAPRSRSRSPAAPSRLGAAAPAPAPPAPPAPSPNASPAVAPAAPPAVPPARPGRRASPRPAAPPLADTASPAAPSPLGAATPAPRRSKRTRDGLNTRRTRRARRSI